jgi:hypothetical protein
LCAIEPARVHEPSAIVPCRQYAVELDVAAMTAAVTSAVTSWPSSSRSARPCASSYARPRLRACGWARGAACPCGSSVYGAREASAMVHVVVTGPAQRFELVEALVAEMSVARVVHVEQR